ncbi:PaaI family thioesterase [Pseudonocardia sp. RS010]|uniref:PaaI family thioesterase n=1 Tax=Pseudonocardia sp. RS010 TaxID=3385979 RepID=UPI0039A3648E
MTDVQPAPNERTHRWEDPAGMAAAAGMDGMSAMRAVLSGALPAPPIAGLLGFALEAVDEARATGWVIHGGRSTAFARGDLRDEAGRLLAEGSSSCMIFR